MRYRHPGTADVEDQAFDAVIIGAACNRAQHVTQARSVFRAEIESQLSGMSFAHSTRQIDHQHDLLRQWFALARLQRDDDQRHHRHSRKRADARQEIEKYAADKSH